ncbi:Lipase member H [Eufriesea mexicana]|uniref:phospholipase A1 n=1 Tax=Eufriesea mexicana TaxID=516756 RepID=A0A310SRZ8_9HYME|nr:Lipase member H [Eufriesea mexicana]
MTVIGSPLTDLENVRDAISPEQDSILYIHGYLENVDAQNVQIPIAAYLDRGDVNVISLDWGTVAINFSYIYSADHVPAVGKAAVVALEKLSDVINLKTLHVIGHSLGAHVAGFIGRSMESTLSRITGLDPALPLFYPTECHLTEDDADFVVILHTDAGVFGTPLNTGSVDFYANRGVQPQPGCPLKILGSGLGVTNSLNKGLCYQLPLRVSVVDVMYEKLCKFTFLEPLTYLIDLAEVSDLHKDLHKRIKLRDLRYPSYDCRILSLVVSNLDHSIPITNVYCTLENKSECRSSLQDFVLTIVPEVKVSGGSDETRYGQKLDQLISVTTSNTKS